MTTYRAAWVLPITSPPLRDGTVSIEDGRITAVGAPAGGAVVDLGRVAVLPGLVNAHTHFELSYLHGLVPPADSFDRWVRGLMAQRRTRPDPAAPEIVDAARAAIAAARASGTALAGDISNTLVTLPLLAEAGLAAHVFHELLGFTVMDGASVVAEARARVEAASVGGDVHVSLAPHAPYSVSPALFQAIREDVDRHPPGITSVHLAESEGEVELLRTGSGPARTMLEELGVWSDEWRAPGVGPVDYLIELGFLDSCVLVVHGVQLDGGDLSRLASLGATLVSCPRSNRYVGVGSPPLEAFFAMDVQVALGTDSLASVADLDMFAELAEARRIAPRVPARALLRSATLVGARALGFGDEFGAIEPGRRAALLVVRVPPGVEDVEEYLVGGIEPGAVSWLGADR